MLWEYCAHNNIQQLRRITNCYWGATEPLMSSCYWGVTEPLMRVTGCYWGAIELLVTYWGASKHWRVTGCCWGATEQLISQWLWGAAGPLRVVDHYCGALSPWWESLVITEEPMGFRWVTDCLWWATSSVTEEFLSFWWVTVCHWGAAEPLMRGHWPSLKNCYWGALNPWWHSLGDSGCYRVLE